MTTYVGEATTVPAFDATSSTGSVPAVKTQHSDGGNAIYAKSSGVPVYAETSTTNTALGALYGNNTAGGNAVYAIGDIRGTADIHITGDVYKNVSHFRIDHPLHPDTKYLDHASVESAELKNIYDGTVVADGEGKATITLPDWFEALNETFRYQLTALGGAAPELHIAVELSGGTFSIAGAKAGQKICWQITGNRRDAAAKWRPLVVESAKAPEDHGYFLHPEAHGAPRERAIYEKYSPVSPSTPVAEPRVVQPVQPQL